MSLSSALARTFQSPGTNWGNKAALRRLIPTLLAGLAFLPTILAMVYYAFIAAPQYVSEASFVVRNANFTEAKSGLDSLIRMAVGKAQDDTFAVNDFLVSRDAMRLAREKVPLNEFYGRPEADFLARYPSILYGKTDEEFFDYLKGTISVVHVSSTGITILRVRAFRPEDALQIARVLLDLGEEFVNRMNVRMQADAIKTSAAEVQVSQERLLRAQLAISDFRNSQLLVDPSRNAVALAELIGKLRAEQAAVQAQIAEMVSAAPSNPQLPSLRRRIVALDAQIAEERARISNSSDGLAQKISTYEELNLKRDFANKSLVAAEAELVRAHTQARRQQLYLNRIASPMLPDYATEPRGLRICISVVIANAILFLVAWLIYSGIRDHAHDT